jgi:hypothetical protein
MTTQFNSKNFIGEPTRTGTISVTIVQQGVADVVVLDGRFQEKDHRFHFYKVYGSLYDLFHKEPQELVRSCGIDFDFFVPLFGFAEGSKVTMSAVFYKINK